MTEDIVERRSWRRNITLSPEAVDAALTNMQRMENEIKSLRAQLAASHTLGFKAGIDAAADLIARGAPETSGPDYGMASEDERRGMRERRDERYRLADAISSIPTPPSILPEILEAMRPVAKAAASFSGGRPTEPVCARPWWAGMDYREPALNVGHLRAIAAVFTKLGGKIDA